MTKAGVWLVPEPEAVRCFICELEDPSSQPAVMDALRELALHGAIRSNVHMVNDVMFLAQLAQYPYDLLDGARTCRRRCAPVSAAGTGSRRGR